MDGVSLTFFLSHFFLFYSISEFYYSRFLTNHISLSKVFFIESTLINNFLHTNLNKMIYSFVVQIFGGFSWKLSCFDNLFEFTFLQNFLLFILILIFFTILSLKTFLFNNAMFLPLIILPLSLYFFYFTLNLLVFILVLEIIATLYYFFFLNTSKNCSVSIIKIKNLIINYIWLSLFTLIFFCYSLISLTMRFGTLNLFELSLLKPCIGIYFITFFLIAVFWKLSTPGFHFFKYELYRFLPLTTIFYFSLFSLLVSIFILTFICLNFNFFNNIIKFFFIVFISTVNFCIISHGISNIKFFQFIALSGFNTITVVFFFVFF